MMTVKEELVKLLNLLSGDLNYDNIAKAKAKLKDLVENKEAKTMWFSPIHTPQHWQIADNRKLLHDLKHSNGCLLAGPGRGDCDHFVGLPEVEDETTCDEYGRPNGWCEVCWRGVQIERHKESLIKQVLNTKRGRKALAESMVEPLRTNLEYQTQGEWR